jgi:ribosomal protein L40E
MGITRNVKEKFGTIKANLTSLDQQPLGKAALVIILFLDIFILGAIFNGLDDHTRQLETPTDYIPYTCREMVIDKDWNQTNRTEKLSSLIVRNNVTYYQQDRKSRNRHPVCEPYLNLLEEMSKDKELVNALEERDRLDAEASELQQKIENLSGSYDTYLLETIASKRESQRKIQAIREEIQQQTGALESVRSRISSLQKTIDGNPTVKNLWETLQGLKEQDRQQLLKDAERIAFWFPVKKLGMQLLFLVPIFTIFYFWNSTSIRNNRGTQALVSSHLLVVSFVPIFSKLIQAIYDVIPKVFLQKVIHLLESLKLVAIWHYLLMAIAVAVALSLIYLVQKKLFSREKVTERRISKGECQRCGKRLPVPAQACPFCGFHQFKTCGHCNNPTHAYGKFCSHCGNSR